MYLFPSFNFMRMVLNFRFICEFDFLIYWRLICVDFYGLCNFIVMHVSFNLISWLFSLHFIDMHVCVSFLHLWLLIFFLAQFYILILQSLQRNCVYFKNIYNESYKEKINTARFISSLNYLHFILFHTSKAIWFIYFPLYVFVYSLQNDKRGN
jgi:hypothetical protein